MRKKNKYNRFPRYYILEYLRDNKNNPIGCIVAVKKKNGSVSVHYSLCNVDKDKYNKSIALNIAFGRAYSDETLADNPPRIVFKKIDSFNERACRYFKINKEKLISWIGSDYPQYPTDMTEYKDSFMDLVKE